MSTKLIEGEEREDAFFTLSRTNPRALNLSLEWSTNPWGERRGRRMFLKLIR
jgi:hypothetical protein